MSLSIFEAKVKVFVIIMVQMLITFVNITMWGYNGETRLFIVSNIEWSDISAMELL